MNIEDAIGSRRSIRRFKDTKLDRETLERILTMATKAPSGKNRQPWRFVVLQGEKKRELVDIMGKVAEIQKENGMNIGSCGISMKAIDESSAVVLVFNAYSNVEEDYNNYRLMTDMQSIGAAVENMMIAATDMGLGTLWICDIFYSHVEICSWLGKNQELVAAVAIGYPDQSPYPRPRKPLYEVVEWLE